MRKKNLLFTILLSIYVFNNSVAQEIMPLVYEVENTGADCPKPYLPPFSELPTIQALPDPFMWSDGRGRISNFSDWRYRRAEISAQIQNYEIGVKPVRPDTIQASYSGGVLTVNVTVNGRMLTLTSQVTLPTGTGPFPAVIGTLQSVPSTVFSSRNIAQITFNYNQVTTDGSASNTNPYYQLYPYLNIDNTGQYSAWAWGVSRIIDGLEMVQNVLPIDLKHIAVSGCSRGGKMALFAGALDERIALTIAQESGGGGATSWRYSATEPILPTPTVEGVAQTSHDWFMEALFQFGGNNVSRLPEDHHELMAMVAPRALFVTANPDIIWLSNPSCYVASRACQQVYTALGIAERFGYSIVGGHNHCAVPSSQIPEIGAFVDKFLLGNNTANTNIATTPYSFDLSPWITWTTPTLSNGSSFFGKTSLIYPSYLQIGLDTNITFRWNSVQEAEKYFIQLSLDSKFSNIIIIDSTTADTSKTITGLLEGKKYYWRVQVKIISGTGPWSDVWNFSTTIALPAAPQLVSAAQYPDRPDFMTFKWKKVKYADQYLIQVSAMLTFSYVFKSASILDTLKTLYSFAEGIKYYWRVQANNIAGSSPWSDISNFTIIIAPTDLVLQRSAFNEITLAWTDNSAVEDGYVIERKQNPQTSFTALDTIKGSGNVYVDKKVEDAQTYTYRVKAYKDSVVSDYSNEAFFSLVGIKDAKEVEIPTEYSIGQNYPNPFNPTTIINYDLPASQAGMPNVETRFIVSLKIFNILGQEVATLVNEHQSAGKYSVNFDANNLPSGVYYYRIQSGDFIQTKKMILMK